MRNRTSDRSRFCLCSVLVPVRETLFQDIQRLLPGQSLRFGRDALEIDQAQTFADLASAQSISSTDALHQLDELFDTVHRDIAQVDPSAVTLLSGGVDSCMVHAHWMKQAHISASQPSSMSITTEAPETQLDTHYATTAAKHFGSRHEFVTSGGDYLPYLLEDIHHTAEAPNHVQGVFYRELGQGDGSEGN